MRDVMLRHWVRVVAMGVLALCSASAIGTAVAETPPPATDPFRLYGNEIDFDVERDGNVVGQHIVTFTHTDQGVRADSRADIDVGLLFMSAYKLRYQAHELWVDGKLQSIEASTNDNGDYIHLQARRDAT